MANETIPDVLKNKSDEQLAEWQAQFSIHSDCDIMAEREWHRREIEKQHDFNSQLLEKQHDFNSQLLEKQIKASKSNTIFTAVIAIVAVLLGVVVAYLLNRFK